MSYVLQRVEDDKYVTPPGSQKSYTDKLEKARFFATREDAERDRCVGNERIVDVGRLTEPT